MIKIYSDRDIFAVCDKVKLPASVEENGALVLDKLSKAASKKKQTIFLYTHMICCCRERMSTESA